MQISYSVVLRYELLGKKPYYVHFPWVDRWHSGLKLWSKGQCLGRFEVSWLIYFHFISWAPRLLFLILLFRSVSAIFYPQEIIYWRCSPSLGSRKAPLSDYVLHLSDIQLKYFKVTKRFPITLIALPVCMKQRYSDRRWKVVSFWSAFPPQRPARLPFQHEVFLPIALSRRLGQA